MQTSAERGLEKASPRTPSDRELVSRFLAARDESAFAEIVTRYSRLVMSVALHTLRDPHAAEDAFQAAFLVLARSARRIRNRDSLASWLHGTTYRVSQRLLRTRLRRKEQDLPQVELPAPIWADPVRPDEQAALDEELARLSEGLRGPLVLHYLEGRTVPEIAAELKMTQSAVEGRLKRGKKTLRKRLLKRGVLLSSAVFGAGLTVPLEAGVSTGLVTATVAACLTTAATAPLAPIAASTIQQIALQEMTAMARIAILKTTLVCGGVAGAIGLAGAGANGTLGSVEGPTRHATTPQAVPTELPAEEEAMPPLALTTPVILASAAADEVAADQPRQASNPKSDDASKELQAKNQQILLLQEELRQARVALEQLKEDVQRAQAATPAAAPTAGTSAFRTQEDFQAENAGPAGRTRFRASSPDDNVPDEFRARPARGNAAFGAAGVTPATIPGSGGFAGGPAGATLGGAGPTGLPTAPGGGAGAGFGGFGSAGAAAPSMSGLPAPGAMGMEAGMMPGMPDLWDQLISGEWSPSKTTPPRPRVVDDVLRTADKMQAKGLREYLAQLERRSAAATAAGRRGAGAATPGEVREFRPQSPTEERMRKSLDNPVDFQFTGQTLQEVMTFVASQENMNIQLDTIALTNAGVGPDQEINLVISGISLRSALNLMLKDVGGTELDYIIENDVMTVTTREKADTVLQSVVYDVSALGTIDPLQVQAILERTVEPASWEAAGGKGTIVPVDNSVIVTTSRRLHDKTSAILKMLQQSKAAKPAQ